MEESLLSSQSHQYLTPNSFQYLASTKESTEEREERLIIYCIIGPLWDNVMRLTQFSNFPLFFHCFTTDSPSVFCPFSSGFHGVLVLLPNCEFFAWKSSMSILMLVFSNTVLAILFCLSSLFWPVGHRIENSTF